MFESVAKIDTFKADVEEYFQMIVKGEYDNDSPFVIRMENFLCAWLRYSTERDKQAYLQKYMKVFAKTFGERYYYIGSIYSGRYSGKKMPVDRLACWSPDYNVALFFAFEGCHNYENYGEIDDEKAKDCLIARKEVFGKGDNFYLSLFLERVIMEFSNDDLLVNHIERYLDIEDEVISVTDDSVSYFTHGEITKSINYAVQNTN